ncbi:autotransporter outer membrane beta-barrel domain-containing protein [Escherichia coli]|nr:autotransporter outer membrane beta-barrel domain-containing protein [Escherichia coli]MEB7354845.1 autotransporter outer membrane beta-barrel domain-containing protein [Escherichia coli]MEB7420056.1 autotransporter outer membrane beta-barrel domain-containing protein [Escherichia coli]
MNKLYKVIWSMALNAWVVVSEISSFIKKKSCCLCSGLILVSPFSLGADIECHYSVCYVDGNIIITTERNLIDEVKQQAPSSTSAALWVGEKSEANLQVISGGKVTTSTLQVGVNKNSVVDIRDGGEIIIDKNGQNITSLFNIGKGGEGTVNIDGAGSVLNFIPGDEEIIVGDTSAGYLNITNGGKFISTPSDDAWGTIYAGGRGGASGVIKVSGKGSLLEPAYRLYVGAWGDGKLEVTSGGIVNTPNFSMGYISSGEAIVSGTGSQLNIDNTAAIVTSTNINARGTLIINNGGKVTADAITLGSTDNFDKPSTGTAEVLIGGESNNIIQEAGILDANRFIFRGENTSLTIKHASDNFNLVSDISSQGRFSNQTYYYGSINAVHGLTTLSGNNSGYNGALNISSPARINVTEQNNLGNATIANDGTLSITSQGNWTFSNTMTGLGFLDVNTGNNTFSFQNATNTAGFRGTLMLSDTSFDLSGDNTAALTLSLLRAGSGSMVTVGAGTQNIDGLGFNGGTVDFGKIAPGKKQSNNMVHVSSLDLQGGGAVQVDASGDVIADTVSRDVNTSLSLLEQDDENAAIQLVSVSGNGRVVGSAGGLQLQDQSGQRITDSIQHAVIQNGQKVAEGTYDYRLTSGTNNDGLYIGYGLTQLNLLTSGTDALELDANGKTGNAADMSARITGTGDLAFNSQKGETVSLSNQNNDYTGVTDIRGGNVLMNSNSALGQTSEIRLAADTQLDMNGHSQTAGKLNGAAGSVLNINGGNLTLTEGGVSAGILSGNGALNVSGGVLDITGASSTFTASTTIAKDAVVRMNDVSGLGTGNISNAGTLSLTHASGSLGNNLSGTGTVSLLSSDTQLSGNNSGYSGLFIVDESSQLTVSATENLGAASVNNSGTLVLNSATDWQLTNDVSGSGTVRKTGSGSLTVGNNAAWTGQTDIDAGTLILGNAGAPVMLASSQVNIAKDGILTGFGGVSGNVTNSGTLDLRADAPGNVLTVGGNYTGNNGTLLMNTVLGDDSSATDKLVIKGDASGQTRVEVTKAGGTGAQTLNGIELIHVDGNADSAEFVQARRIAAGAYDYTLGRGQGSNSGNWYLTSGKNTPDPEPTPTPDPGSKPEPAPGGYDNDLRPEAGSYTANMAAANTMFVTRLHDRLGPVQYTDVMTGETKNTSMWMRHEGGHNRWRDGTGQLKTQGNRYVVQLGGDIAQWGWGETDRWHLGVMAGYGNDHNNTDSVRTGYRSKGSVNGYSTGLYATWFASDETHNGAYLDTWAQYGWFDNHVKGDGLPGESWKSKGLTASLETGYTWKAGEFSGSQGSLNEWYVQPQAQVVWMGVKADEHRESNGTRVENTGDGNVRTRLGVKTWIKGHNRMDDGKSREFRPFVEVNWLHNTRDFGTRMNGVTVHQDGARNIGEVKAGVEGQINNRLNLWGNVGVQAGDKGYSDTSAMLGVKYTF